MEIDKIEKKLKVKFKNKDLLIQSITHKSYDRVNNNEKLEFLGDRVLGFVIAKKLLELYPDEKEGILDKKLASLVNKTKCSEVCEFLQLNKIIKTNNFSKKNNIIENKIISDTCEALIGAIYLDGGFTNAKKFINTTWGPYFNVEDKNMQDSKTKLQELSQQKQKKLPQYNLIQKEGPSHSPTFTISLKVLNLKKIICSGSTIRDAEKNAASIALKLINEK